MGLFSKAADAYAKNEAHAAAKRQGKHAARAEKAGDTARADAYRRGQSQMYGRVADIEREQRGDAAAKRKWVR